MKTIDTAPRDGTPVRLFCDDGVWRVGRFDHDDWWLLGRTGHVARVKGATTVDPDTLTATHWESLP